MSDQVDLHIHSSYSSDGDHPPHEILQMARDLGLRAISITDHDAVEGSRLALLSSPEYGLEVVPAVEITTFLYGRELHILSYFVDITAAGIVRQMDRIRECDEERVRQLIFLLERMGIDVTYNEVKALSPNAAPKCSIIIKAAMTNGRNVGLPLLQDYVSGPRSDQPYHNFFLDHMRPGRPAYVEPLRPYSATDAIDLTLSDGGVPVLAHPGGSLTLANDIKILDNLRGNGLCGLEVYSSYHTEADENFLAGYCARYDLIGTAGSDFHGTTVKPKIRMGLHRGNPYALVQELRERARSVQQI